VLCDFVVGADGAWSKIRGALTNVLPHYTGVSFWEISHPNNENHKNGTLFALDQQDGVMIVHINTTNSHAYFGGRCEKDKLRPLACRHSERVELRSCLAGKLHRCCPASCLFVVRSMHCLLKRNGRDSLRMIIGLNVLQLSGVWRISCHPWLVRV
jgi:hypothetical protein